MNKSFCISDAAAVNVLLEKAIAARNPNSDVVLEGLRALAKTRPVFVTTQVGPCIFVDLTDEAFDFVVSCGIADIPEFA